MECGWVLIPRLQTATSVGSTRFQVSDHVPRHSVKIVVSIEETVQWMES